MHIRTRQEGSSTAYLFCIPFFVRIAATQLTSTPSSCCPVNVCRQIYLVGFDKPLTDAEFKRLIDRLHCFTTRYALNT